MGKKCTVQSENVHVNKRGEIFYGSNMDSTCKCDRNIENLTFHSPWGFYKGAAYAAAAFAPLTMGVSAFALVPASEGWGDLMFAGRSFPDCISEFKGLKKLEGEWVGFNSALEINRLPGASMETMELAHNHIDELPDLSKFPKLKRLDLRWNPLKAMKCDEKLISNLELGEQQIDFLRECQARKGIEYAREDRTMKQKIKHEYEFGSQAVQRKGKEGFVEIEY